MIALDTASLLWWVNESPELSVPAAAAIQTELDAGIIYVSCISVMDISERIARGELALATDLRQWIDVVSRIDAVRFVAVDNEIALAAANLPGWVDADPVPRIIIATSRQFAAPLVTRSPVIRSYQHVNTIW